MQPTEARVNDAFILYDADAVAYAPADCFDTERLAARGWLTGSAAGRGRVHFFRRDGTDYVLRHYRRGGRVAWLNDRYFWTHLEGTRAWREWRLLARLQELDLPAPRPFAARVQKRGCVYRADLITARCPGLPLAERLKSHALCDANWDEIGRAIRGFHDTGVWHADLNAHNVLLDSEGAVTLIDFDRARFRAPAVRWRATNLDRLLRSLRKLKKLNPNLCFREHDVESLRRGYRSAASVPKPTSARCCSTRLPGP